MTWGIENEPVATAARIQAYVDTKVPEVALRICLKRLGIPGPQEIHDLIVDYIYVERYAFHLDQITKECTYSHLHAELGSMALQT